MIGINPDYDYLFDPQQKRPDKICEICGEHCFGRICLRCERRMELEDDEDD